MNISLRSDLVKLTKNLSKIQKKQIPFATKNALNAVAFSARSVVMNQLKIKLDRPTTQFVKSVRVAKATKQNLISKVGFAGDIGKSNWAETPAHIMSYHIYGGTRLPIKKTIAVPTKHQKKNKYGNLGRSKIKQYLGDKDRFFSGVPKGIKGEKNAGIWQRMPRNSKRKKKSGNIRMLVAWEPQGEYEKRFPMKLIVEKDVSKMFPKIFDKQLKNALTTAR